jgi:hypothetical protein
LGFQDVWKGVDSKMTFAFKVHQSIHLLHIPFVILKSERMRNLSLKLDKTLLKETEVLVAALEKTGLGTAKSQNRTGFGWLVIENILPPRLSL